MNITDEEAEYVRFFVASLSNIPMPREVKESKVDMAAETVYPTLDMGSKTSSSFKIQDMLYQQVLEESEFCDVTIMLGDLYVKAHWCVLVSCPYFRSLHGSRMMESHQGTIKLNYGTPWAMKEAIKFIYSGQISLHYDKIRELLEAAEYLQITDLKKCCSDYLYSLKITEENCVQITLLASLYDLEFYTNVFEYLKGHLPTVLNGDDALTLTQESVMSLLTDETLTYVSQETFLHFVIKWTKQDLLTRKDSFCELFFALKLESIPKNTLKESVEKEALINEFESCKTKVEKLLESYDKGLFKFVDKKEVLIVGGGYGSSLYSNHYLFPLSSYKPVNNLFGFIIDERRWIRFAPLPGHKKSPLFVSDNNGNLYLFDKAFSLDTNQYLFCFSSTNKEWTSIRLNASTVADNVYIYNLFYLQFRMFAVASGNIQKSGASRMGKTLQYFIMEVNLENGELTTKTVLFPKTDASEIRACSIESKFICVTGNKLKSTVKTKQRTQKMGRACMCYNVVSEMISKLPVRFNTEQQLFNYNGCIMSAEPGKTNVKVYAFSKRRWEGRRDLAVPLPPVHPKRTDYSYLNVDDNYYMMGGKTEDSLSALKDAMVFNRETKEWETLDDMPEPGFSNGVCLATLSTDVIKCHINCPHCKYNSPRSQVKYSCFNSEYDEIDDYDEDEDEEYSINNYSDYDDFDDDDSDLVWRYDDDSVDDPMDLWYY